MAAHTRHNPLAVDWESTHGTAVAVAVAAGAAHSDASRAGAAADTTAVRMPLVAGRNVVVGSALVAEDMIADCSYLPADCRTGSEVRRSCHAVRIALVHCQKLRRAGLAAVVKEVEDIGSSRIDCRCLAVRWHRRRPVWFAASNAVAALRIVLVQD